MRNEYKYSAFISHSGNLDDALKLQRKIARYSLPLYLRDKNKSFFKRVLFPERLKKCILDATDFSANKLSSEIKEYIEESKDIIVICSHNTGNPLKDKHDWVSDEIRYYLGLGRGRSPIPFVVEGEPYTNDENECFPLALREIKDKDIYSNSEGLGANLKKDGWWKATIRVIAGLLDLPFDDLWQREKRRRRRKILFVTLFVLCLLSLAFAGYRQLLKSEYARKAKEIMEVLESTGDYYSAKQDALKISPSKRGILRPYVPEVEGVLRIAMSRNDFIVRQEDFVKKGDSLIYQKNDTICFVNPSKGSLRQFPAHLNSVILHPTKKCFVGVHMKSVVFYDLSYNLIDSIPLSYCLFCYECDNPTLKISSDGRYLLVENHVVELKHVDVDKVKGCLVKTNQRNNCFYTLSDSVLYKYDMSMMKVVDSLCLSNTVLLCQWKVFGAKVTQMDHTLVDVSSHNEYVATVRDNVLYLWSFKTKRCESTIEMASVEKLEFDKNQDNILYVFQSEMNGLLTPKTRITKLSINGNVIKKENSCLLRYGSIGNGIHNHVGIIDEARYFTTFNDTLLIVDPLKSDNQSMSGVKLICTENDIKNCWICNNKLIVLENDAVLHVYDVKDFKGKQVYQYGDNIDKILYHKYNEGFFIYNPQFNNKGRFILYKRIGGSIVCRDLSDLQVIDTKTSHVFSMTKLVEHVPVTNFMFTPDDQYIVYSDHEYTYIIDFQDDRKLVERALAICK